MSFNIPNPPNNIDPKISNWMNLVKSRLEHFSGLIDNANLANMGSNTIKGNNQSTTKPPQDLTISNVLDLAGTAQGSIIYRGSTAWTNLPAGTSGNFLQTQGTAANPKWAGALIDVKNQTFAASGTYTPSSGMFYCDLEVWGGGGGGGGVTAVAGACAAGGGAGGYAKKTVASATIGASQIVTVGTAGTAGGNSGATGGTGGSSSIGSIVSATGGSGGQGSVSAIVSYNGGSGGVGSSGDVNATGQLGGASVGGATIGISGFGGSTSLGGGGQSYGTQSSNPGNAGATNSGSGGSGANNGASASANIGGTGAKGFVLITEYCSQ